MRVLLMCVVVLACASASGDYYDILVRHWVVAASSDFSDFSLQGVAKDASPALIRRAYRRKAAKVHPDRAKNDPKAKDKFLELGKAYSVLSDPKKRQEYDQFGKDYVERKEQGGGGGGGGGGQQFHFQDMFGQFFGGGGRGGGGGGGGGFRFEFGDDGGGGGGSDFFGNMFGGGQFGGRHHQQQQPPHGDLFASEDSPVTLLSGKAHKKEVLRSNKPWLVMYFSNDCQACHVFAPAYEKLATKFKHIVRVGAVDCSSRRGSACEGVDHYPTLRLFNGEDDVEKRSVDDALEYTGELDGNRVGNWVLRNMPANVVVLRSLADYRREFEDGRAYLTLPTCILFSVKGDVPPIFGAISRDFAKQFDFAFVSVPAGRAGDDGRRIMAELGMAGSELPLLVVRNFVVANARTERLAGAKELSFERMSDFLTAYATAMRQIQERGPQPLTDRSGWDRLCPVDAAFLCVVAANADAEDEVVLASLAKRFAKDPVRFLFVRAGAAQKSQPVLRAFGSSRGLVVVNRRKHKWASGAAGLKEADARTFVESVLSGSARWTAIDNDAV